MNGALVMFAVLICGARLRLPLPGAPWSRLVVAGAYFGGLRGGIVVALWAIFVATVGFFVLSNADPGTFVVSLAAYALVGLGLGMASTGSSINGCGSKTPPRGPRPRSQFPGQPEALPPALRGQQRPCVPSWPRCQR